MKNSVTIQAPASTSNCGSGFDTLSVALSLYNFIRVTRIEDSKIRSASESEQEALEIVIAASNSFFEASQIEPFGIEFEIWGEVPIARGLGSSSTVRGGIVAGLNELSGRPLDQEAMIRMTTELDNAPDNACAVFAGGFCIARTEPATFAYREHVKFSLPSDLVFIAVSPDYQVLTETSRRVLPDSIPFADAVRSANSLAFLVGTLVSGNFARLKGAVNDYIHQPYRETLNPFGHESIEAGCHAGAYTGWLSGSGSTVICVTDSEHALGVGQAMENIYTSNDIQGRVYRLTAENQGLVVVD